ncbi:preprotein translocase subunit SecG [Limimaricola pyoseonensis]|uniref:Protein-export membrane protein SecG n=1 Tax=Limimaricola pyoseonensis TaxID=521013 RepID=A0A1G7CQX2_9RHOB|nr:preprotein translocase subunit SecG [Limimaricola pyoseonensis]SDE41633.1 protein translocase subunit secG [Limimaricola pyoseonensis]
MENVVLIVHLILALALIGVVLLQRSEGGGLGMGGGGGGVMSGRAAATALGKVTWGLAGAFIVTSIALTIIAANNSAGGSVLDRLTATPEVEDSATGDALGESLLPPSAGDGPVVPLAD